MRSVCVYVRPGAGRGPGRDARAVRDGDRASRDRPGRDERPSKRGGQRGGSHDLRRDEKRDHRARLRVRCGRAHLHPGRRDRTLRRVRLDRQHQHPRIVIGASPRVARRPPDRQRRNGHDRPRSGLDERRRAGRDRRRRRRDALRHRRDRRRRQHHHRATVNGPPVHRGDGRVVRQSSGLDVETRNISFERALSANDYSYVGVTVPSGTRINADAASTTLRLRGDWHIGAVQVNASAGISQMHLGVRGRSLLAFASPPPNPALASSYQSSTSRQNSTNEDARLTFALDRPHTTTTLDLSATRDTLLYYSSPGDLSGCYTLTGTPCNDLNVESRVQASLRQVVTTTTQRLVYGIDLAQGIARIDAGDGAPPTHGFAQTAAYAQDAVGVGRSEVYGGVRAERDGGQGGAIAPSFGFIQPLSTAIGLRANYAVGFRAPDSVDLYYPGFSNPNLQPERTQSFDVTATDTRVLGGLSLCYFTVAGNNLITVNPNFDFSAPPGPGNEPVINAQHTSTAGFTLDAKTPRFGGFTTTLGVTDLYRALDLTTDGDAAGEPARVFDEPRARVRRNVAARDGRCVRPDRARHGRAQRRSRYRRRVDPTQYAAAYTTVNGYLRLRAAPRALVTLRVYNLGNERYSAVASPPFGGYPVPGRAFGIELSTR